MARALKEERPIRGAQAIAERPDGERRWFEPYPTPLFDAAGRLTGGINLLLDITERIRAQQALQDADRRKDEFLALLAHELRNPLAPIRTGLELIRLSGDTPQSVRRVRLVMERQVSQMVRLIDDLLDVSRIASGKIVLQQVPSSLAELVQGAIDAHRTAIEAAKIDITVDLPGPPCVIDVDPTRFAQVLSNVLHNAVKFTPGQGTIRVSAETRVSNDGSTGRHHRIGYRDRHLEGTTATRVRTVRAGRARLGACSRRIGDRSGPGAPIDRDARRGDCCAERWPRARNHHRHHDASVHSRRDTTVASAD